MNTSKKMTYLLASATAVGAGLIASAPAQAADVSTWEKLAQCESGGDWSINTGNGFGGGLQFTQSTWSAMGGSGSPQNASKAEQIRVAERTLAAQGWGAWPACSAKLGLSGGGSGYTPEHQDTKADYTPAKSTEQKAQSPQKAQPQQAAPKVEAPKVETPKATTHTPKHKAAPAAQSEKYTVVAGDTLGNIAKAHHVDWRKLADANKDTVHNPNLIYPGQVLTIPGK